MTQIQGEVDKRYRLSVIGGKKSEDLMFNKVTQSWWHYAVHLKFTKIVELKWSYQNLRWWMCYLEIPLKGGNPHKIIKLSCALKISYSFLCQLYNNKAGKKYCGTSWDGSLVVIVSLLPIE